MQKNSHLENINLYFMQYKKTICHIFMQTWIVVLTH